MARKKISVISCDLVDCVISCNFAKFSGLYYFVLFSRSLVDRIISCFFREV